MSEFMKKWEKVLEKQTAVLAGSKVESLAHGRLINLARQFLLNIVVYLPLDLDEDAVEIAIFCCEWLPDDDVDHWIGAIAGAKYSKNYEGALQLAREELAKKLLGEEVFNEPDNG